MPKEKKKCRVCGKLYTSCRTVNPVPGAYNWREVACSPECSVEYVRRVTQARNKGGSPDVVESGTVGASEAACEADSPEW